MAIAYLNEQNINYKYHSIVEIERAIEFKFLGIGRLRELCVEANCYKRAVLILSQNKIGSSLDPAFVYVSKKGY